MNTETITFMLNIDLGLMRILSVKYNDKLRFALRSIRIRTEPVKIWSVVAVEQFLW
jgi:hypothetical protein